LSCLDIPDGFEANSVPEYARCLSATVLFAGREGVQSGECLLTFPLWLR